MRISRFRDGFARHSLLSASSALLGGKNEKNGVPTLLLPQRPYVPSGTLKTAVVYPSVVGTYDDHAVRQALEFARLAPLACEIDTEDNWRQRLSGGEQQRLAIFLTSRIGCSSMRRHRRLTRSWKFNATRAGC